MLKEHVAYTNSEKGKEILKDFEQYLPKFKKIMPNDYKAMLNLIVQMEERGLSSEQAKMEAFNIKANAGIMKEKTPVQNLRKNESNILTNFIFLFQEKNSRNRVQDVWTAEYHSVSQEKYY